MNSTWNIASASTRGTSHSQSDLPCQDALATLVLEDGTLIAAVADGAGSALHAEIGSRLAVDTAIDSIRRSLESTAGAWRSESGWRALMRQSFSAAIGAIDAWAIEHEAPRRELASTLLCLVATDTSVACAQKGDSLCVIRDECANYELALEPERGEYANEVALLTDRDAVETVQFVQFTGNIECIAMSSDGLMNLFLSKPGLTPLPGFFDPLFDFVANLESDRDGTSVQALEDFLNSERVNQRTDDDKTLILAVRRKQNDAAMPIGYGERYKSVK